MFVREVVIAALRRAPLQGNLFVPDLLGKAKTAASYVAITAVLLDAGMKTAGLPAILHGLSSLAPWLMLIAITLTVASGLNYLLKWGKGVSA